jgi:RHS repeat-associated protein
MPGRTFSSGNYRFGFNGKENDNEVKGQGAQQDYGFRIYDPRLGRFLSVDPITKLYPELTPYQFASNSPIRYIDIDGLEKGEPEENTGNTKVEKSTADKAFDLIKKGVEGTIDGIVFAVTSIPAAVGNTFKSVSKQVEQQGLVKALDQGGGAVLSSEEKFTPIGFSFDAEYGFTQEGNEQLQGSSDIVSYKDGKRLMSGATTIVTSGFGLGLKGFVGKQIFKKALDQVDKKETPEQTEVIKKEPVKEKPVTEETAVEVEEETN